MAVLPMRYGARRPVPRRSRQWSPALLRATTAGAFYSRSISASAWSTNPGRCGRFASSGIASTRGEQVAAHGRLPSRRAVEEQLVWQLGRGRAALVTRLLANMGERQSLPLVEVWHQRLLLRV